MCKVRDRTQKIKRSKIDLKGVLRYTFQMTDRNKEKKMLLKFICILNLFTKTVGQIGFQRLNYISVFIPSSSGIWGSYVKPEHRPLIISNIS